MIEVLSERLYCKKCKQVTAHRAHVHSTPETACEEHVVNPPYRCTRCYETITYLYASAAAALRGEAS